LVGVGKDVNKTSHEVISVQPRHSDGQCSPF